MSIDVPKSQECVDRGELRPAEELLTLVYAELRRLAAHKMAQEAPGQTLQKRMSEIPPYFFPVEYACTDEGTNAFAYEPG